MKVCVIVILHVSETTYDRFRTITSEHYRANIYRSVRVYESVSMCACMCERRRSGQNNYVHGCTSIYIFMFVFATANKRIYFLQID